MTHAAAPSPAVQSQQLLRRKKNARGGMQMEKSQDDESESQQLLRQIKNARIGMQMHVRVRRRRVWTMRVASNATAMLTVVL
jgi:hypothetical protein